MIHGLRASFSSVGARRQRPHLRSTIVSETREPHPDDEVIITVPADMQAGVRANWAVVQESDHAFVESCVESDDATFKLIDDVESNLATVAT